LLVLPHLTHNEYYFLLDTYYYRRAEHWLLRSSGTWINYQYCCLGIRPILLALHHHTRLTDLMHLVSYLPAYWISMLSVGSRWWFMGLRVSRYKDQEEQEPIWMSNN
jgi:hypothetical protein